MQVDFYHLTRHPVDRILPRIAERILAQGGRLLIVSAAGDVLDAVDRQLWAYAPDSFLPHARDTDAGHDPAVQPILLSAEATDPPNGARHIALADGIWRDEALGFDRAFHFFDERVIVEARAAWKALADRDGVERRYWKQDENGRWEQAA